MADLDGFAQLHKGWLFRGQRDPNWELATSLERTSKRCGADQVRYEKAVWEEFRRHAHSYMHRVPEDKDTVEWLAFMQHYGAPTRLLDFTQSFWIALFFAFEESESDCVVVALNPASLAPCLMGTDYNMLLRQNIEHGAHTDSFLRQTVPFYTNDRLAIQKGIFVYSMNLQRSFHDLVLENYKEITKLVVPASLFADIRDKLNEFNCNSRVLFPGIEGYGWYFRNLTISPRLEAGVQ